MGVEKPLPVTPYADAEGRLTEAGRRLIEDVKVTWPIGPLEMLRLVFPGTASAADRLIGSRRFSRGAHSRFSWKSGTKPIWPKRSR